MPVTKQHAGRLVAAPARCKRYNIPDSELKGLGLRVEPRRQDGGGHKGEGHQIAVHHQRQEQDKMSVDRFLLVLNFQRLTHPPIGMRKDKKRNNRQNGEYGAPSAQKI